MYKLIDRIRSLTARGYTIVDTDTPTTPHMMDGVTVNRKRHAKYFSLCLDVLPPRLALHDCTR